MSGRCVALVGGSGFVGRHLAPALARGGWRVRVASRHPRQDMAADGRIVAVTADLRDEDQVGAVVRGADAVGNLVGIAREDVRLLKTDKVAHDLPTPASLGLAARPLGDGLLASLRARP